nr:tetratricopeptide repeat protein [Raineya orbicola]
MQTRVFLLVFCIALAGSYVSFAQSWGELNKQGVKLLNEDKYSEAKPILEKALKQAETEFGKEHPDYATACNNLAGVYENQGRYAEAENLYKEAQSIYAKNSAKNTPTMPTLAIIWRRYTKTKVVMPRLKNYSKKP